MRRQTTKEFLVASFLELAQKKPIDKITITQITDNCGMSQPTFYHHFRDKYDLIFFIHSSHISEITAGIGKDGYGWKEAFLASARYYKANSAYILNAASAQGIREAYIDNMASINTELIEATIRRTSAAADIPKLAHLCLKVYCYGNILFLLDWLQGKNDLSEEEIAEVWEKSLPDPLRPYFIN